MRRWLLLLPGLVVLVAAGVLIQVNRFDGLYGQDAYAYYNYAVMDLREQLYPPPPFFWPPGYPLLVMLVSLVVGANPAAGQIVSLTCGGLVAVFTGLMTYEIQSDTPPSSDESRCTPIGELGTADFYLTPQLPLHAMERGSRAKRDGSETTRQDFQSRQQDRQDAHSDRSLPFVPLWFQQPDQRIVSSLAAGLAMAVVGQLWQSSTVVMADTTALAGATIGMWAVLKYRNTRSSGYLMLASGAAAYAVITRWAYAVVVVVCVVQVLAVFCRLWRNNMSAGAHSNAPLRTTFCHMVLGMIPALVVILPVLIPVITSGSGTESTFGGNFSYQFVRWDLTNAFRREFENPDGFQNYTFYNGIYYAVLPAREFYFTPLLALFALVGLREAVRRRDRSETRPYLMPVVGWGIGFYLLLIGGPQQNVRFGLSYMPPAAVLIGVGFGTVWRWVDDVKSLFRHRVGIHKTVSLQPPRWFRRLPTVLFVVFCVGLGWAAFAGVDYTNDFIARKDADLRIVRWAERQIPPDAQVIAFGVTLAMQHYTDLDTHEIYYLTDDELSALLDTEQPTYLLLDPYNVETQWRGRSPSNNYHWLRDNRSLTRIGQNRNYLLFQVNR